MSQQMINHTEIIKTLEMSELEYLDSLISQFKDNLQDLNNISRDALKQGDRTSMAMVLHDVERLSRRHEIMLNLMQDLTNKADSNVQTAISSIYKFRNGNKT